MESVKWKLERQNLLNLNHRETNEKDEQAQELWACD